MNLCFYEDEKLTDFHPLTLSRPIDDLRIGIFTIRQKWLHSLQADSFARIVRPDLRGVFGSGNLAGEEDCLWINARYLPSEDLVREVQALNRGTCLRVNSTVIAARVDAQTSQNWIDNGSPAFNNLLVVESQPFPCLRFLWDFIRLNGREIIRDFQFVRSGNAGAASISERVTFERREHITIEKGATIEAGCVLDAREGPIYIGKEATLMAGALLRGPIAVCEGATVKAGAKMYGDTTVGPVCKVGGEVDSTIFHSYSNKAHHGYIGHSVVGQWCNFGAGTTVSNLKTNYSNVRVHHWENGEEQDTGLQFVGIIMGDHSKTAINAVINSGTVTGVCCNILSRDFPPKYIHSFSWVGSNVIQPYKIDKALDTMELMMARREVELSEDYKEMMRRIFNQSRQAG
ncbi:UDP-N-acetylglucosamine diphosphorylase/glucosamine-1-phosphate N-acetyltransferase [Fodinibius roseus]|uniref:UDP-N-acetylglucosamine diphosphorylase/glucosamine-1-phosphate N-acetyltransferase n=1 Tax=Fodinibius roseus TaxID=1194090 RepID=A0A1M4URV1_9BACT|nr:putative sugar nucleotidyl transferase [Fodinibius roseus]SHE59367.1 UDP-N-acetylglucosamine diphosphorylase/glucosamine-1-phosphate N-acetyltransferase [Fodinibius roseus]